MTPDDIMLTICDEPNAERAIRDLFHCPGKPGSKKGTPIANTCWTFSGALLALWYRVTFPGMSNRAIAVQVGVRHPAIAKLFRRFDAAEESLRHGA